MHLKDNLRTNGLILFSFFIITVFSFFFIIKSHYFLGYDDVTFHLKRILELRESMLHGVFFPHLAFNQFHGSEIMTFYPYINLLPIAVISMFVTSKIWILNIWYMLNNFLALICSYYGSYSYIKSKKISYVFAVIYSTPIYFLCGGHGFNDFGVTTACSVLPLVFFGCLNFIKFNKYKELSIGLIFLAYSHVLDCLISIIFVIIWMVFNLNKVNKIKIINLIKLITLTLSLSSVVWLPMVISLLDNKVRVFLPVANKSLVTNLVSSNTLQNILLVPGSNAYISIFAIIGIILSIMTFKYLSIMLKKMFMIALAFIWVGTKYFPWTIMPKFILKDATRLQYISRIFIIPQLILSFLFALILFRYIHLGKVGKTKSCDTLVVFVVLVILALFLQINYQKNMINSWSNSPIINKEYYLQNNMENNKLNNPVQPYRIKKQSNFKYLMNDLVTFTNYNPTNMKNVDNIFKNNIICNNDSSNIIHMKKLGYNTFEFKAPTNLQSVELPFVNYNKNNLNIKINNHYVLNHESENKQVMLKNISKGVNVVRIKEKPHYLGMLLQILMVIYGVVMLINPDWGKWSFLDKFR